MAGPWRCFHCDEVFTTVDAATDHFGPSIYSDPACTIDAHRLRELEAELRRHREEDTDLHRALASKTSECLQAVRRADDEGYAKALRDMAPVPRPLAEYHEDSGPVVWWALEDGQWLGEPAWIGTPTCDDWPGYHTHWTPHPTFPLLPGNAKIGAHHLTPESIAAAVADLRAIESGTESPELANRDHRTRAGVLALIITHLLGGHGGFRAAILQERERAAVIAETPVSGEQDDITMEAKDRVAAAIRAGACPPAERGWQPIETAPKEPDSAGITPTILMGYMPDEDGFQPSVREAAWNMQRKRWVPTSDPGYIECPQPTHWMPLPEGPSGVGALVPPSSEREQGSAENREVHLSSLPDQSTTAQPKGGA